MLELRYVVDNLEEVRAGLSRRSKQAAGSLDAIAELAQRRSAVITEVESLRHEQNEANQAMAKLDKKSAEFTERRDRLRQLSQRAKELKTEQDAVEAELEQTLLSVPNIPLPDAPDGSDDSHNVEVRAGGHKPSFDFAPKDHADIGSALGILDFARAAKISGARFTVLRGAGARLERALMAFMLDLHSDEHGYTEVWPPALVLSSAMRGTGQLPKFAADSFRIASDWEANAPGPRLARNFPTADSAFSGSSSST
jgi:seryl-tRNA synthetase